MIGRLKGIVVHRGLNHLIIEVNGVGYKVFSTSAVISGIGEQKEKILWTHTAVRENALELFGFQKKEDLNFFELLITIPGIGPDLINAFVGDGILGTQDIEVKDVSCLNRCPAGKRTQFLRDGGITVIMRRQ